jgi:hypothetical protein
MRFLIFHNGKLTELTSIEAHLLFHFQLNEDRV